MHQLIDSWYTHVENEASNREKKTYENNLKKMGKKCVLVTNLPFLSFFRFLFFSFETKKKTKNKSEHVFLCE